VRLNQRIIQFGLAAMFWSLSFSAEAQQPKNVPRLGFLDSSTAPGMAVPRNTLREELTKLGWAEGKNETVFKNYFFYAR
jgi:hypothetical protein